MAGPTSKQKSLLPLGKLQTENNAENHAHDNFKFSQYSNHIKFELSKTIGLPVAKCYLTYRTLNVKLNQGEGET